MPDAMTLYHGCRERLPDGFAFGDLRSNPEGIHLGRLEQARIRAGRGDILEVRLRLDHLSRLLSRRKRSAQVLVYLNRYEGTPLERAVEFSRIDDARLSLVMGRRVDLPLR